MYFINCVSRIIKVLFEHSSRDNVYDTFAINAERKHIFDINIMKNKKVKEREREKKKIMELRQRIKGKKINVAIFPETGAKVETGNARLNLNRANRNERDCTLN